MFWTKLLRGFGAAEPQKQRAGKPGARAYAIGDVHGCLDLLNELLASIERDIARDPPAETFIIFIGDLIDRGPDSAGVIERLRTYRAPGVRTILLMGNHEEFFLRVLAGEMGVLDNWLRHGGRQCVESYGLEADRVAVLPEREALALIASKVPSNHRSFLEGFADSFRFGDYVFVHAGIRPGLGIDEQKRSDLRWIREPFLHDTSDHGFVVVHGHTIVDEVEERPNRICIDTGAYRSGNLSALVIDGTQRRYLSTARREGPAGETASRVEAGLAPPVS